MTEWKERIEEGHVFYMSDIGNIYKDLGGNFTAIMPATVKLGPFETLEQAQQAVEENILTLRSYLDAFNSHLVELSKAMKLQ